MVGPGGGPPRKSHTKSRNGCKTCKRRHIRCDETFPQCRNCTKHNCRCDYQDQVTAQRGSPPASRRSPDLLMSPEIEMEIDNWHRSGVPPYPELLQCPRSGWSGLSRIDLRLIHHIIGLSIDLHRRGLSASTVWAQKMPNFLAIALNSEFVMSAILSLSAFHLAFLTRHQETRQLAVRHQVAALQGLQAALVSFSKDNCDAILAASVLLSWQATEHQSWVSLQHGISGVLESMHPYWKQESELAQFIENQRALGMPDPSMTGAYQPLDEDLAYLDQTIQALRMTQKRVSHNLEHSQRLGELVEFTQQFRDDFPNQTPEQLFESIQTLRRWLFWLPPSMLRNSETDISALPILAQFFAIGLSLDRFFPELGGAYLGALSIGPIEEMYRIIAAHNATDPFNPELRLALSLMDLPHGIVARYRSRLPWSPRSSVDHYSSGPSSPYRHAIHDYPLVGTSSPASASPSYAAYTPPLHSPPAVTIANSPFPIQDAYVSAAPSHSLYPPSPQLLDSHDGQLGLSDLGHAHGHAHHSSIPNSASYTPPYGGEALCADLPRTDGTLGLNMEVYPQTHPFEIPGLVASASLWT
ncbi:C6 transcription factor RosA-like [Penicillium paradoxum]|uniref:C6 transcription factor RosA-like n=1 Tax=Penicillium paradoxum TaxID=176176 RepID=UPI00254704FF|nr:C6 transcription factor RosA-like [Penicillium paradoxum]KAJ5774940.1 C6 transcription factor RosA-like [Penicillium paradoxum]